MSKPGATIEASQRALPEIRLGGRLAGLSLPRQVAVLAIWPLLENLLAFCVGLTDMLVSGRLAEGAERVAILDAMGLGGYVAWFFNILQGAVATGVMALVARATGAKDGILANRGLGQGLWMGIAAGTLSLAALHFGIPTLIRTVGLGAEASRHAETFLRILALSGPISGALFAINAALRGSGDTRTPFIAMLVVNGVNMGVSVWLALYLGYGVAGIAWGTVSGWAAGLVVVISAVAFRRKEGLTWSVASLLPHGDTIRRIARVGAPQTLEIGLMWAIHAFGIHVIATLPGQANLGAHILAIRVESLSFLPGWAIGTAGAALVGQYLGAGSKEMATRAVRICWKIAVLLMTAIGICFLFTGGWLIELMAPGSEVHRAIATPLVMICAAAQPFFATCIILKTSMRGAGATGTVIRWSFGSMVFYRIGLLWLFRDQPWFDLRTVWVIFSLDLVTQALVFAHVHFRGKWLDAKV